VNFKKPVEMNHSFTAQNSTR